MRHKTYLTTVTSISSHSTLTFCVSIFLRFSSASSLESCPSELAASFCKVKVFRELSSVHVFESWVIRVPTQNILIDCMTNTGQFHQVTPCLNAMSTWTELHLWDLVGFLFICLVFQGGLVLKNMKLKKVRKKVMCLLLQGKWPSNAGLSPVSLLHVLQVRYTRKVWCSRIPVFFTIYAV